MDNETGFRVDDSASYLATLIRHIQRTENADIETATAQAIARTINALPDKYVPSTINLLRRVNNMF